jgi:hypothetical protein
MYIKGRGWGGYELDYSASGYGKVAGCCENGHENSGSITCRELLAN